MTKLDEIRKLRETGKKPKRKAAPKLLPPLDDEDASVDPSLRPRKKRKANGKRKTGHPRLGQENKTLEAKAPWEKLKMSRRTWFRRQAEKRAAK